jgi:MinD superfamily P-loop ATPase
MLTQDKDREHRCHGSGACAEDCQCKKDLAVKPQQPGTIESDEEEDWAHLGRS